MTELYEKVREYVYNVFEQKRAVKHFERAVYWLKQLKSDVDEALLIATIAHDIERSNRSEEMWEMLKEDPANLTKPKFLKYHQETGAEVIGEFLEKQGANKELIDRVKMLVSKHEEGGNEDQNLLKDADSISFFENNAEHFLDKYVKILGKEAVKIKFDWMYNRITSEKAKEIAKKWYEDAVRDLEKQ
ncbi:MAG: DUF4202 family protein [Nanoarchaeota archaeon]|nr:DUF4202 family protein [Nanoarchaeota archaeon]